MITMVYKPIYYDRYKSTSLGGHDLFITMEDLRSQAFFLRKSYKGRGPKTIAKLVSWCK